jgi:uncharacterized membrane protein
MLHFFTKIDLRNYAKPSTQKMLILGGIIFVRTFHEKYQIDQIALVALSSCCSLLDCSSSLPLELTI